MFINSDRIDCVYNQVHHQTITIMLTGKWNDYIDCNQSHRVVNVQSQTGR